MSWAVVWSIWHLLEGMSLVQTGRSEGGDNTHNRRIHPFGPTAAASAPSAHPVQLTGSAPLHDGDGRRRDRPGLVLLTGLEDHELPNRDVDRVTVAAPDLHRTADHGQRLASGGRVPTDHPARYEFSGDHG